MGPVQLSGADPAATVSVSMSGSVHGGQPPVGFSKIQLYTVGSAGYGSTASEITTVKSTGTSRYYPGGTTGCITTADTITGYSIVGGVATLTAANTLIAGQLVTIADSTVLNSTTPVVVMSSTATTFTVATTAANAGGTDTGTATPMCYNTPTTDLFGNFVLTGDYNCGTNGSSIAYITATGGNPGISATTNNPQLKLAAPLGKCSSLASTTVITINEVTTAAMALAMGQYFTTTYGGTTNLDSFGSPNTTQAIAGLVNAAGTVNNLVSTATGIAVQTSTITANTFTITTTPEYSKLNTIADILSACVNSTGTTTSTPDTSNCGVLFADVTPTNPPGTTTGTAVAPTDTLQAAVYMSLNPTATNANGSAANLTALFGLISSTPPFAAGAQPTDFTVGILYTDTTAAQPVLTDPLNIAIDVSGNVWVVSNASGASGALGELSPLGSPLVGTNFGGAISAINPRSLAIDLNGNVWVPTSSSSGILYEYTGTATPNSLAIGKSAYGVAIDGNNNVFVAKGSTSSTLQLQEFINGTLATTSEVNFTPIGGAATTASFVSQYLAVDTAGNVWTSQGAQSTAATTAYELTNISSASCGATPFTGTCTPASNTTTNTYISVNTGTEPFGLAANNGTMWIANAGSSSVTVAANVQTGTTQPTPATYGSTASVTTPHFLATDGNGNVWVASNGTGVNSVSEFSNTGTVLSPGTGFAHNGISGGNGVAIDPSGNVWVADNHATGGADGASVFEIVGAATPTVTPIALALKNGAVGQNKP